MKRILLRSPKDPFEVVSPRTVFGHNLIGNNAGNLVFIQATHRILAARGVEIETDDFMGGARRAAVVNERFDVCVIPLANSFRISYESGLRRMIRFIEQLTIPVVILGVGAQSNEHFSFDYQKPIEPLVRQFVSAVLDRGPSIGVRGEMTAEYLRKLGFSDIEVIGCPSMFLHGDHLSVEKRQPTLERSANVSINVSPYVTAMGPIVMSHLDRYPNLTYIPQDLDTLGLLIRGDDSASTDGHPGPMPFHVSHPLFEQGKVRFYVEPWPWMNDLAGADFSFGTRIHGNIAALLAGTPAYVFAHDSRTLELARYFRIPHRLMSQVPADIDAADLHEEADFSEMNSGHAARFATFVNYLGRHGVGHVFADGEDPGAFDRRIAATDFPPAVISSRAVARPASLAGRLHRARYRLAVAADASRDQAGAAMRRNRKRLGRWRRRLFS